MKNLFHIAGDICEMDFEPGTQFCEEGQSAFAQSRMMWYHCPYCRKCKMFRWSGCGGNENRFETEKECKRRCAKANPWKSALREEFSQNVDGCRDKSNFEIPGLPPMCDGMVKVEPSRCDDEGWIRDSCHKSCCIAGRSTPTQ